MPAQTSTPTRSHYDLRRSALAVGHMYVTFSSADLRNLQDAHRTSHTITSNLMIDTFIANANTDESVLPTLLGVRMIGTDRDFLPLLISLREILRSTLAASPPAVAITLTAAARHRLIQTKAVLPPPSGAFFVARSSDGVTEPTAELTNVLSRIRALYGAGLGFASLEILAVVVRATIGIHWEDGSDLEGIFASIDADISQAIQSSREEWESGRVTDIETARVAISALRSALEESRLTVEASRGGYRFEQGEFALDFWKI